MDWEIALTIARRMRNGRRALTALTIRLLVMSATFFVLL